MMKSQNKKIALTMMMPSEDKSSCFQPILSLFRIYGINFNSSPGVGGHRWVSLARALMLYIYTSGSIFVGLILCYSLRHNAGDIGQICLWAAFQSMVLTSFIFYVTSLRQQSTIAEFLGSLEQTLAMSSEDAARAKSDCSFVRRLCIWISAIGFAAQLLQSCLSAFEIYYGRFHLTVSETSFHLSGYPVRAADFRVLGVLVSTTYDFLASTFMQLYASTVLVICLALNICLRNLKQIEKDATFLEYHRKHQQMCQLIRQTDSLFSLFLCITLIRDVVIVVLLSRILKSKWTIWDAMQVVPIMAQSFASLCAHTYCASQVNEKVYTSLDAPPSVGSIRSDGQTNEDPIRHMIYIARLSSNKVGLTMWGFLVISKGLIFTTIGTMVTYIIVLWQFG